MEGEISVRGIVIADSKYAEYDKRLVILTAELGKITVFANGARRQNNRFTAAAQKYLMGSFKVRQGRGATYTLCSAEIEKAFLELTQDIEMMCYASYFCELTEFFSHEGVGAGSELNLLYLAFQALIQNKVKRELIKSVFELKLLDMEGMGLQVASCVKSGKQTELHHIDFALGGLVSDTALSEARNYIAVSDGAIYILRFIMASTLGKLFSFNADGEIVEEVEHISSRFLFQITNREFKSLEILKDFVF